MPSRKPSVSEAYKKAVEFLKAERVPFVVVGGLAASLQGEPRNTDDVDFMVTLPTTKVYRFAEKAKRKGSAERHKGRLDVAYLRKWAAWLAAKSPKHFSEVPPRLDAVLENGPLPPQVRRQGEG